MIIDTLWHEAHAWWTQPDGRNHPEPCAHAVVGGTPTFLHLARCCGATVSPASLGPSFVRVRRSTIAEGRGAKVRVLINGRNGLRDMPVQVFGSPPAGAPADDDVAWGEAWEAAWESAADRVVREVMERLRGASHLDAADLRALGLKRRPTGAELTAAWRVTAKRTHPDHGGDAAQFIEARAAYERLRALVTPARVTVGAGGAA